MVRRGGLLKDEIDKGAMYLKSLQLSGPAKSAVAGTVAGLVSSTRCTTWNSYKLNFLPIAVPYIPHAAVFFGTYDAIKKKSDNPFVHMYAAAGAELCASMVYVPLHTSLVHGVFMFRRRIEYPKLRTSFVKILKEDGWKGLYRTHITRLACDLPFSVIVFPLYESFSRQLYAYMEKDKDLAVQYEYAPVCGAAAGLIAGALTTPLMTTEVAMTRNIRVQGPREELKHVWHKIKSKRWKTMREFYKGGLRRTALTTVWGGSVLGLYEIIRSWF